MSILVGIGLVLGGGAAGYGIRAYIGKEVKSLEAKVISFETALKNFLARFGSKL